MKMCQAHCVAFFNFTGIHVNRAPENDGSEIEIAYKYPAWEAKIIAERNDATTIFQSRSNVQWCIENIDELLVRRVKYNLFP